MIMAWVAVDEDGFESVFDCEPYRDEILGIWSYGECGSEIQLPKGSIKKLIDRELTWKDEPVELE